jgi:hypothetical protein
MQCCERLGGSADNRGVEIQVTSYMILAKFTNQLKHEIGFCCCISWYALRQRDKEMCWWAHIQAIFSHVQHASLVQEELFAESPLRL